MRTSDDDVVSNGRLVRNHMRLSVVALNGVLREAESVWSTSLCILSSDSRSLSMFSFCRILA